MRMRVANSTFLWSRIIGRESKLYQDICLVWWGKYSYVFRMRLINIREKKGPEERVQINENLDNRGSTVIAYFTEQTVEKNHSVTRINIKFNTAL